MPRSDSNPPSNVTQSGFRLFPGLLDAARQRSLLEAVLAVLAAAPAYHAYMPKSGQRMSVAMSNAGRFGWYSDRDGGYRYIERHPETDRPWPAIPDPALAIWWSVADYDHAPECCLINLYREAARMGLHQDRDEAEMAAPVVSISLGDDALFRLGGTTRKSPTRSFKLASGDVLVLGGNARLAYHGIDRVMGGTSRLVPGGGRINLTLRRVTRP
jgi:alkylated DNA repair protein (DNA oxidative demethylase)